MARMRSYVMLVLVIDTIANAGFGHGGSDLVQLNDLSSKQ